MQNFSWSWTRLSKWRSCPKRHYHLDIAKDIPEPQTEALRWGDEFHKAVAAYIENGTPLPDSVEKYEALPGVFRRFKERTGRLDVELEMAMTRDFEPSEWRDWDNTWLRAKIDLLILSPKPRIAFALDWKTGRKIQPEFEQLGLSAALIFAKYPTVETVHTSYQWIAHNTETFAVYQRGEMVPFWNKLMPELKRWEKDAKEMTYPPKPSGLCKAHCPVVHCAYHGKGNR